MNFMLCHFTYIFIYWNFCININIWKNLVRMELSTNYFRVIYRDLIESTILDLTKINNKQKEIDYGKNQIK